MRSGTSAAGVDARRALQRRAPAAAPARMWRAGAAGGSALLRDSHCQQRVRLPPAARSPAACAPQTAARPARPPPARRLSVRHRLPPESKALPSRASVRRAEWPPGEACCVSRARAHRRRRRAARLRVSQYRPGVSVHMTHYSVNNQQQHSRSSAPPGNHPESQSGAARRGRSLNANRQEPRTRETERRGGGMTEG